MSERNPAAAAAWATQNAIETPMASEPIAAAESLPQCPAMAVEMMPISGTVMFDTMEGKAICSICLSLGFIYII